MISVVQKFSVKYVKKFMFMKMKSIIAFRKFVVVGIFNNWSLIFEEYLAVTLVFVDWQ